MGPDLFRCLSSEHQNINHHHQWAKTKFWSIPRWKQLYGEEDIALHSWLIELHEGRLRILFGRPSICIHSRVH